MTTPFPRSLSCVANTALHRTKSEQLTHFVSNTVTRLLCSSTQPQHENPLREQAQTPPQESLHDENKQSHEPEEDHEDGDSINKSWCLMQWKINKLTIWIIFFLFWRQRICALVEDYFLVTPHTNYFIQKFSTFYPVNFHFNHSKLSITYVWTRKLKELQD